MNNELLAEARVRLQLAEVIKAITETKIVQKKMEPPSTFRSIISKYTPFK